MSELIDTTEMYLRTVYELLEEGVPPLRARIAERLHQSGPTVSQTVARMERDGLLTVKADRTIKLTPKDDVERRLLGILESPTRSPYGNPIPGLRDLGLDHDHVPFREGVVPLSEVVPNRGEVTVTMERMSENLQADAEVLSALAALGLRPGVEFVVRRVGIDLRFCLGDEAVTVDEAVAELLFVASH